MDAFQVWRWCPQEEKRGQMRRRLTSSKSCKMGRWKQRKRENSKKWKKENKCYWSQREQINKEKATEAEKFLWSQIHRGRKGGKWAFSLNWLYICWALRPHPQSAAIFRYSFFYTNTHKHTHKSEQHNKKEGGNKGPKGSQHTVKVESVKVWDELLDRVRVSGKQTNLQQVRKEDKNKDKKWVPCTFDLNLYFQQWHFK